MKAWGCLFPLRCKACRGKSETCKISEQGFLSHFHLLFKMSVPSPAHSTRTSLLPQNPMWVDRSHSCMTPAKLKLNFHLSCQLGRKNRWSWERSLHPHRCPPHGYLSLKLPTPRTCPLCCCPFFCSFLPYQNLLISPLGITQVHVSCTTHGCMVYLMTTVSSLTFYPPEHKFFFPVEGNALPYNYLLKMSKFTALPPLQRQKEKFNLIS